MGKYQEYYDAIDEIKGYLSRDLIGPVELEEVLINEEPLARYVMGILWPRRLRKQNTDTENAETMMDEIQDEEGAESVSKEDDSNESIRLANSYCPSSMAISAMLPSEAVELDFTFNFARYIYSEEERKEENDGDEKEDGGKEHRPIRKYSRKAFTIVSKFDVPSALGNTGCHDQTEFDSQEIDVRLHVRKIMDDGSKLITVSISNTCESPKTNVPYNENALFQCELAITGGRPFLPIYQNILAAKDEDALVNAMLYRNVRSYAYGHGCSVRCVGDADGGVRRIDSDFIPNEQVLQMMPNKIKNASVLRREYWRIADKKDACGQLRRFCGEYETWRKEQETAAEAVTQHEEATKIVLKNIEHCIERIENGISTLENNDIAWRAFLLMNEAMLLQQIKTRKGDLTTSVWYPFQLAYILQIIPDVVNENSSYKNVVDLLWFPAGGGKTEAYLGVSAFVIFYRRLFHRPVSDGVAIIMRYTLRLLTLQQFDRAMALICACEYLRKRHNIDGGPISIGLWIGGGMTPNHLKEAAEKLDELRNDTSKRIHEGNPLQVTKCPWCGALLDVDCYDIGSRMTIRCKNNRECEFHQGLPIHLIDDDIYQVRPTLIVSTIDKFARIVWEENAKTLFGFQTNAQIDPGCPPPLTPDLIIQDELHLISGPLGTLAGLYETAVEKLCARGGSRPKIIASTATVKNARQQIRSLYNREMFQFPPSGISFKDSFFAAEADKDSRPARRYIGLCKMDGSLADLLIRVYADLWFIKNLFIKQGKTKDVVDQFFTTIGYFNAIKDLGASASMIQDRLAAQTRSLFRKFGKEAESAGYSLKDLPHYFHHDELTSRKTAQEIRETLSRLEISCENRECYSYVLASNMISVGIDVNRLGIMTVYNQPKSNAEYIQATSRVGRQNPGVVLVMYNTMRSRDKSHYEQFGYYHKSFYQYVEATSVTPFSSRAIEKALHCVFIALVRHGLKDMGGNDAAARFRKDMDGVDEIRVYILDRIRAINPRSEREATQWVDDVIHVWDGLARRHGNILKYRGKEDNGELSLLNIPGRESIPFPAALNSLRNVEASSNVYIQLREEY